MEVETVMRKLSTVESSIVQSPDVPVVGAKIRCYAVQQDAIVREAFKEHCQMLLALNLVQSWHDCLWEPGLSWPNVLKEESEGRGEGETGHNAYQDERHQPVVVVLVKSADVLATNPVAYVSLLQRQAFSMPSWTHVAHEMCNELSSSKERGQALRVSRCSQQRRQCMLSAGQDILSFCSPMRSSG